MADYSMSRSNYLKLMYGKVNQEINSLTNNTINAVGDTSYQSAEIFAIQQNNQNAIDNAQKYLNENSMHTDRDRNGWQRFWDTIGETINDIAEGLANFGDDIYDFFVYTESELGFIDKETASKKANYDWQAQFVKGTNVINPAFYLSGDAFTEDFWTGWDSTSARAQMQQTADSSLWNELGEDGHRFVKNLGQGIGYMIPTLVAGALTGGASTGVQAAATLGTTAVGAFTGGVNDTYEETGNYGKSLLVGAEQAIIEVGSELVVGKALGAIGAGTGKIAGAFGKGTSQTADNFVKTMAKTMFEEGVEEAFSAVMQPVVESTYKGKEAFRTENGKFIYFDKDFWWGKESVAEQALLGATMGGILGGVSTARQFNALGKEGVATSKLLEENKDLYNELGKYEKTDEKYTQICEKISENTAKIAYYVDLISKSGNQTHIDNLAKLLSDPLSLKKALETKDVKEVNKLINNRIKELANPHKVGTRNLFNELQSRFNTDYELEFGNANGQNAYVDRKNKKIVINENISDEYAGVLAHEYLGHAIVDGSIDQATRQKIFDSVVKSDWFKKYNKKLRENYIEKDKNYQSLETPEQKKLYWQSEVINNYLEDLFKKGNTAKSVKMINDVFLRNTLLNRMQAFFNKKNNLNLIKNNAFLSEFTKSVKTILDSTNKNVSRALDRFVKGETLNKTEENYYKKYKAIFDNAKLAYSKNLENAEGLDINNKSDFVEKIEKINKTNLTGKIEIENLDLSNLAKLIEGHLDFIDLTKPIVMENAKLRKVMKPFDKKKHFHGLTAENIYNAIKNLNDPYMITQTTNKPKNIAFITKTINERNENILVAFELDYILKKEKIYVNHIESIYGLSDINLEQYEKNNKFNDKNVIYNKKRGWFALVAPATSSTNSISDNSENINKKYSKSLENKTFENPDWYKKQLEKERPSWIKDYEYKVIDIERLVKDNDLGDGRLGEYHEDVWGKDETKFKFDEKQIEKWKYAPITVKVNKNGKYILSDGNHRVMALYNSGYKNVEVLVKKSLDSNGNTLTLEQTEFFKDSKVRDDKGNLLVVYHSTNADFTVFDSKKTGANGNKFGDGFYFSSHSDNIYSYGHKYKTCYLNIKNPFITSKHDINLKLAKELIKNIDSNFDEKVFENAKNKKITEFIVSKYLEDKNIEMSFTNVLKKSGFDGVIADENGDIEHRYTEIVAFYPNQIKNINNLNPTESDDIRYSKRLDSEENPLTEAQERYFKDSKFVDEEGNLLVLYHGSDYAGFMTFDNEAGIHFFTPDYEIASTYTSTYNLVNTKKFNSADELIDWWYEEGAKELGREDIDILPKSEALEEINEYLDTLKKHGEKAKELYNISKKNYDKCEYVVLNNEYAQPLPYTEKNLIKNFIPDLQYYKNLDENYEAENRYDSENYERNTNNIYKVYVNATNPLIVNCRGRNFTNIIFRGKSMQTDEIAKIVKEEGKYDGIIFKNVVDNGGKDFYNDLGMSDVYVAFDSKQIKAVDNYNPTNNDDIRYSKKLDVAKTEKSSYNEIKQEEVSDEFRKLQEECRKLSEEVSFSERSKSLDDSIYGRIKRVLSRQIGLYNSRNSNSTRLLKNTNNFEIYENIDGDLFHDCFEIARTYLLNGELVDLHDNYNDSTCYLSKDGLSGFAITQNGDLISVFNLSKEKGFLRAIAPVIKSKAKTLDCFISSKQNLQGMYEAKFGFKTASVMDHNMEYDHDDIAKNHNNPKVAFMVNTDKPVETRNFDKDSYDQAQAYQQSFIQDYQVATLSTPVDNTTTKVEDLTPYETNKAQAIKEGAQEKLGKTINLKNTQDVYNTIESGIQELFGEDFKIDNKKLKARRLFEEYNIAKNSAKKPNCRKFVVDILAQEVFDNVTYKEYLQANGFNIDSVIQEGTELMFELLNARAVDSNITKKINKLNKWIDLYKEARAEQVATFKFMKTLNSIRNNLSKHVTKYGNTGQLDTTSGIKGLFYSYFSKFRFTRANYLSLTNIHNLQNMIQDGSFKNLINSILNPYNEVTNLSSLQAQAETIVEMAEELANSLTQGQKHLNYDQIVAFNNLNKAVYHLYKEYTSGVLEATREQALKLQGRAKEVSRRKSTNKAKNKLKKAVLDAMSPKEIIAEMVGGTHTEEFNLIYNDLYRKPYERQIDKYVDFLKERDKCIKNIQKEMNKKVKVGNLTVRKYVLFQFYLNTLSPDNLIRMKNSNLTYTEDGITKRISFNDLEVAMNKYINPAEKADLDNLFKLYNTSVKKYVEKISEKNLGFKTSRDNYYPIVASEVAKNQDLSNPNKVRYNINAMNNGRLKKLSNKNTTIEININPIHLFDSYIESMTITGEIGLESQKLNRLFQLKDNNGNSFSSIVNEYVPHAKDIYIPSIFNKLIGNTQTIQRSSLLDKMVGKFSTATLGLNIRSMLKQIGSFFTAWEKVGIGTGFKVMLNPKAIKRIFKNRAYLKANNPVFKLRTHENGYVRGATLSAGATQFGSKVMQTITNASLKGIEAMDRLTCYATFTLCEEYVKKTHGYEIGSDENLKLANEMFSEMILETQSNSDRISMSRVRSGEKGAIVKNLFGLFQSDAQNKAGLLFNIRNDIRNINKDIIDVEAKIKNTTDPEAKKKLEDNRNILKRARTQAYARMRAYATGLLLSGIAVALADKLADYIYDKEDPKDTELSEVLMAILGNTTIDWIPYLNQIANWWQYDGVEISALEMVNDLLETIKGFTDGEVSSQDFMQAIIQLGTVCGLPLNNLNKLVQGTISNFDPEAGIKYKSLFYNMSQSYLGRETNSYIENGNIDKARASLSLNFSLYKFEADDELTKELVSFKQNGINISIKNTPTEITDAEGKVHVFTEEEMSKFRNIYSGVNVEFKKMKADNIYQKLSMEEKAKAVKKLTDLYFDKAKGEATSKLAMLASKNIPVYSYILIMTQLQEVKGKDNFIKEINKIRTLNKKEKLLLMSLMGYSVSELSKPTLLRYLRELGLSSKEIEKWGEK